MSGYVASEMMLLLAVFKSSNGKTSSHIDAFKNNQRLEIQFPSNIHSITETFFNIVKSKNLCTFVLLSKNLTLLSDKK